MEFRQKQVRCSHERRGVGSAPFRHCEHAVRHVWDLRAVVIYVTQTVVGRFAGSP